MLRHRLSKVTRWLRYSWLPRFTGGPRIIVTKNVIIWHAMDTRALSGMLRQLLGNEVPAPRCSANS